MPDSATFVPIPGARTPSSACTRSASTHSGSASIALSASVHVHPGDDAKPAAVRPRAVVASRAASHGAHAIQRATDLASDTTPGSSRDSRDPLGASRKGAFEYEDRARVETWRRQVPHVPAGPDGFVRFVLGSTTGLAHDDKLFALRHAARQGAPGKVTALLKAHEDLGPQDLSLALHDAAEGGHFSVMLALASRPGVVDTADEHGLTALCKAIAHQFNTPWSPQHRRELNALRSALLPHDTLRAAAERNDVEAFVGVFGVVSEALREASRCGYLSIVQGLLDRGCPLQIEDELLKTPLHHALENGHLAVARALLDNVTIVDTPDIRRTWASDKAERLLQAHPADALAAEVNQRLRDVRLGWRRHLDERGIDWRLCRPAEDLMERLPPAARQGHSANVTYRSCLILAEDVRSTGPARPLAKWASALGLDEEDLLAHQLRVLDSWDQHFHKGRLPANLRSPVGSHLRERGHAAVLLTGLYLSVIVNQPRSAVPSLEDMWMTGGRIDRLIDALGLSHAAVLAADHYLRRLPFDALHAALCDEYRGQGGRDPAEPVAEYWLAGACLLLADLHLSAAPRPPEQWGPLLGRTPPQTEALRDTLLSHLGHGLEVPGLSSPIVPEASLGH